MEKAETIFLSTINEKLRLCQARNYPVYTEFLDSHFQALAEAELKNTGARYCFWGGYEYAERRILAFLPDYMDGPEAEGEESPLCILRVSLPKGSKALSHRDYLGSILGLGIRRELTGDILVRENGADIIILSEMSEFLYSNYVKAGRANLSSEIVSIDKLDPGQIKTEIFSDTVASLRLDSLVASVFKLPRAKAQDAIKMGLVSVNSFPAEKPDMILKEGDRLSMKTKGKARLSSIGGRSRKDRIYVSFEKFI